MASLLRLRSGWAVWIVIGLIAVVLVLFAIQALMVPSRDGSHASETRSGEMLSALVRAGDAERGAALVETMGCAVCHVRGAANGVAPSFEGVAARAETRRAGLAAESYLYESIVDPGAYVVNGFPRVMPENFAERLSQQQLADILAFLLSQ